MKASIWVAVLLGVTGCGFQQFSDWDKPPRALYEPEAHFSEKVQHFQAHLVIDSSGQVVNAEVVGEPRGYRGELIGHRADGEIVAFLKQYRFKPAEKDGHPVPSELMLETNFDYF